jgi:uncharacterized protein
VHAAQGGKRVTEALRADHDLAFTYRRSAGGAERRFLSGLARAEVWGSVDAEGRVEVPPVEWDPATGTPAERFVRVGDHGVVRSWTWVAEPGAGHPLDRPYALALIQLEGADTALLHFVEVDGEQDMRTAMAVRADWRTARSGSILDIRAFVPGSGHNGPPEAPASEESVDVVDVEVVSDVGLHYRYEPGHALSSFLRGLAERRIQGGHCPSCAGVYVPPHATCPACRTGPMARVDLGDEGTITSFTVVHVPFHGMTVELPFVCAWIRLDGADVPFAHLIGDADPDDVEVGRRVQAVWVADEDLAPTWESIKYFRLTSDSRSPSKNPWLE